MLFVCLVYCFFTFLPTGETRPNESVHFEGNFKSSKNGDQPTCGYEGCPEIKETMLNVHLVPHTHDDVGWLKTVDQYFYGNKNNIQNAGVQYILDSVISELIKDPSRRFIYVEIAFFYRWWMEQTPLMQQQVRTLVDDGRLEFILGGWCMNDEATTHYNAIIDQHTLGFRFLANTFGECGRPRVAWQVDPFGHSREQASLFAQMGFDGLFFGRLDYQDKILRLNTTNMEFVWRGSPKNLGSEADLFTGVTFNGYGPPPDFCGECDSDPIMDDKRLHDYNVEQKVQEFIKAAKDQTKHFKSNHIMMTMGGDFRYQDANMWYKNMDKIIKFVNAEQANGSDVNVFYSTPSCYLFNVNHLNQIWNSKDDDFFPYADRAHDFWTGYFTSRPALKLYVRETNSFLQACKQLNVLAKLENTNDLVNKLAMAMGVLQHHDAVSGTEKQHVAYDYALRLSDGIAACESVVIEAFNKLLLKRQGEPTLQYTFCGLRNISRCNMTETSKQFFVTIYNPLGIQVQPWIRVPVSGSTYHVTLDGQTVDRQVIPVSERTKSIPERNGSIANSDLLFQIHIPPLGISTVLVQESNDLIEHLSQQTSIQKLSDKSARDDITIGNKYVSVILDGQSGKLLKITNLEKSISVNINHEMAYYISATGDNRHDNTQASGAYTFRPNGTEPRRFNESLTVQAVVKQGPLVTEVQQTFSPWASNVIRVYKDERYVEFEWTVGPIPIKDLHGKEVISRFTTDMNNRGVFYTDANGREILERRRDYRKTWRLNQTEPVAGNYYPINSRIFMKDTDKNVQFTVMTDRSQGGSSIRDGSLEIMVHRRTLYDDSKGVGEPLNETGSDGEGLIVRGKHYIFIDTIEDSAKLHREFALRQFTKLMNLKNPLPDGVHMLTLEKYFGLELNPNEYIIRFEHFYEADEAMNALGTTNITFSLGDILPFEVTTITELTLGANLEKSKLNRLPWSFLPPDTNDVKSHSINQQAKDSGEITLTPMEIRTFLITRDK